MMIVENARSEPSLYRARGYRCRVKSSKGRGEIIPGGVGGRASRSIIPFDGMQTKTPGGRGEENNKHDHNNIK